MALLTTAYDPNHAASFMSDLIRLSAQMQQQREQHAQQALQQSLKDQRVAFEFDRKQEFERAKEAQDARQKAESLAWEHEKYGKEHSLWSAPGTTDTVQPGGYHSAPASGADSTQPQTALPELGNSTDLPSPDSGEPGLANSIPVDSSGSPSAQLPPLDMGAAAATAAAGPMAGVAPVAPVLPLNQFDPNGSQVAALSGAREPGPNSPPPRDLPDLVNPPSDMSLPMLYPLARAGQLGAVAGNAAMKGTGTGFTREKVYDQQFYGNRYMPDIMGPAIANAPAAPLPPADEPLPALNPALAAAREPGPDSGPPADRPDLVSPRAGAQLPDLSGGKPTARDASIMPDISDEMSTYVARMTAARRAGAKITDKEFADGAKAVAVASAKPATQAAVARADKPVTRVVNGSLYAWNPRTQDFDLKIEKKADQTPQEWAIQNGYTPNPSRGTYTAPDESEVKIGEIGGKMRILPVDPSARKKLVKMKDGSLGMWDGENYSTVVDKPADKTLDDFVKEMGLKPNKAHGTYVNDDGIEFFPAVNNGKVALRPFKPDAHPAKLLWGSDGNVYPHDNQGMPLTQVPEGVSLRESERVQTVRTNDGVYQVMGDGSSKLLLPNVSAQKMPAAVQTKYIADVVDAAKANDDYEQTKKLHEQKPSGWSNAWFGTSQGEVDKAKKAKDAADQAVKTWQDKFPGVIPANAGPALADPAKYKTLDELKAARQRNEITRDDVIKIAREKFGMK